MQKIIYISAVITIFMMLFFGTAGAQGLSNSASDDGLNQRYQQPLLGDYLLQAGGFIGTAGSGVGLMFRPGEQPFYGNIYLGGLLDPQSRIEDARDVKFGGFTLGYERVLNPGSGIYADSGVLSGMREDTQFYFRVGAGANFTKVRRINTDTGEYIVESHPGIHTTILLGTSTRMTQTTSFYMEVGGRMAWNSNLYELRWLLGPHVSFGVQLFGPRPGQLSRF